MTEQEFNGKINYVWLHDMGSDHQYVNESTGEIVAIILCINFRTFYWPNHGSYVSLKHAKHAVEMHTAWWSFNWRRWWQLMRNKP